MKFSERIRVRPQLIGTLVQGSRAGLAQAALFEEGLDFLVVDMENATYDLRDLEVVGYVCAGPGLPWLVRLPQGIPSLVGSVLGLGAVGVVVPNVESVEDAIGAVAAARIVPHGVRGWSAKVARRLLELSEPDDVKQLIAAIDDEVVVMIQLESEVGISRADEILAVPGVDAVLVGPGDLSLSLGVPGQVDHPSVIGAATSVLNVATSIGVAFGIHCTSPTSARLWLDLGAQFVTVMSDVSLMRLATRSVISEIRAAATSTSVHSTSG